VSAARTRLASVPRDPQQEVRLCEDFIRLFSQLGRSCDYLVNPLSQIEVSAHHCRIPLLHLQNNRRSADTVAQVLAVVKLDLSRTNARRCRNEGPAEVARMEAVRETPHELARRRFYVEPDRDLIQ